MDFIMDFISRISHCPHGPKNCPGISRAVIIEGKLFSIMFHQNFLYPRPGGQDTMRTKNSQFSRFAYEISKLAYNYLDYFSNLIVG